MAESELSLTEWVVLALVSESPTHGFAIAKELHADSDLGRIMTVHRPLVYRALDRLRTNGFVEAAATEPGDAGPNRTLFRATRKGRSRLKSWFITPVGHVRELRIEFLIKLRLTERVSLDPAVLVTAQREALAATLQSLAAGTDHDTEADGADVVDRWRQHNAAAARDFLASL